MANLRDIKRRIKSVRNTSQITKAMQMVASAKMRRAQELALKGREYMSSLARVLGHLQESISNANSPLLEERENGRELIIVVSTDRGLCGGLNSNLLKEVLLTCPAEADYVTIGSKLNSQLTRCGRSLVATFSLGDTVEIIHPEYGESSKDICSKTVYNVLTEKYDAISVGKLRRGI